MAYAPIALFTFKRPAHTRCVLESLVTNPEFQSSPLIVYCDGARNDVEAVAVEETRRIVRDWPHPNKTLIERDRNWGLAKSVIEGVSQLCTEYGRVIVVEDDLVVSPAFLHYLNAALDRYADQPKVMQVSAYMFPVDIQSSFDAVMLPFTTSWGWATWSRAWAQFDPTSAFVEKLWADRLLRHKFNLNGSYPYFRMLKRQAKGQVDSWAIRWYASVFLNHGLALHPCRSLVKNDGYGVEATHTKIKRYKDSDKLSKNEVFLFPPAELNMAEVQAIFSYLQSNNSVLSRIFLRLNIAKML